METEETNLRVSVEKDSASYRFLEPNSLWKYIRDDIESRYFGALAHIVRGKLMYDTYLKSCYIKDFAEHGDEAKYIQTFEELIKQDVSLYSGITSWAGQHRHYIESKLGYFEDFKPAEWTNLSYARMVCGKVGSGKTSLLLYTKSNLEEQTNFTCIIIHLTNPTPDIDEPWSYFKRKLVDQLNDLILEYSKKSNISNEDVILKRFERIWEQEGCYPDPKDTPTLADIKRKYRDEIQLKLFDSRYTSEFIRYIQDAVEYLKSSLNMNLIVMIDDVDRLPSEKAAREVCDRVRGLAAEIGTIPVIVAIRGETMAKLDDVGFAAKFPIIPPSFSKVLHKRLEVFLNDYKMEDTQAQESGYDTDKVKTFVKHIVESVLEKETYSNLMAYHYDLEILLDVVRCLIQSPLISPEIEVDKAKKSEKIPWHIILDSIQRFRYINFYETDSFILNVFDNDQAPPSKSNTLIRVRLLQVVRYRFRGLNKPIPLAEIYSDMNELGYDEDAVFSALSAFTRQRMILTGRLHNEIYNGLRDIQLEPTIAYYLDSLLYSYRYLQNILPVTHIPFDIPPDILDITTSIAGEKLRVVDQMLMKFIEFIRDCEKNEKDNLIKKESLFKEITREETLSDTMEKRLKREIQTMKKD